MPDVLAPFALVWIKIFMNWEDRMAPILTCTLRTVGFFPRLLSWRASAPGFLTDPEVSLALNEVLVSHLEVAE